MAGIFGRQRLGVGVGEMFEGDFADKFNKYFGIVNYGSPCMYFTLRKISLLASVNVIKLLASVNVIKPDL